MRSSPSLISPSGKSNTASQRGFDSLAQEAYLNLWRTYDRLRMQEDALFAEHDLTAQQYNALRLLRARHPEPMPTLNLAERLISRAPDITRLLDRLEQRGLIVRERPPENRRLVRVGISARGLALLNKLDQPVRRCHEEQLGHLPVGQLEQLIELLHACRRPHEPEAGAWAVPPADATLGPAHPS